MYTRNEAKLSSLVTLQSPMPEIIDTQLDDACRSEFGSDLYIKEFDIVYPLTSAVNQSISSPIPCQAYRQPSIGGLRKTSTVCRLH